MKLIPNQRILRSLKSILSQQLLVQNKTKNEKTHITCFAYFTNYCYR